MEQGLFTQTLIQLGCFNKGDFMIFSDVNKHSFKECIDLLQNEKINEYGFTPICVYAPLDKARFCRKDSYAIIKYLDAGKEYTTVLGDFNSNEVQQVLQNLLNEDGILRMEFLSSVKKDILVNLFKDKVKNILTDECQSDYIYNVEEFLNMSGKQNRHKREQYNAFVKNNNYVYKPISKDNITDCLLVCDNWCNRKNCEDCEYTCERNIIKEIVDNFCDYPVDGGIIYIDNKPKAFLLGEFLGDTFMGYHQKTTEPIIKGLGCSVYIEAFKNNLTKSKYFNIGPDLGIEGLRQFKRMFKPYTLIDKFSLIIQK